MIPKCDKYQGLLRKAIYYKTMVDFSECIGRLLMVVKDRGNAYVDEFQHLKHCPEGAEHNCLYLVDDILSKIRSIAADRQDQLPDSTNKEAANRAVDRVTFI